MTEIYHVEWVGLKNVLSRVVNAVLSRRTRDVDAHPLVDEEDLVAVLEPADVLDPRQPGRHQLGVGEEAAEEQEGQDEGGADGGGDGDVGRQAGDEVPWSHNKYTNDVL